MCKLGVPRCICLNMLARSILQPSFFVAAAVISVQHHVFHIIFGILWCYREK